MKAVSNQRLIGSTVLDQPYHNAIVDLSSDVSPLGLNQTQARPCAHSRPGRRGCLYSAGFEAGQERSHKSTQNQPEGGIVPHSLGAVRGAASR